MMKIAENIFLVKGADLCSNVYILLDGKRALLIDAGDGSNFDEVLEAVDGFELEKVILTHGHLDHIGGMRRINAEGMLHKDDLKIVNELNIYFPYSSKIPQNLTELKFNSVKFGKFDLQVLHTPGHTPGSICLFEKNLRILFSGDTLFADGFFGRTDLFGGDSKKLVESLEMVKNLCYKMLCPGHNEIEGII